MVYGVKHFAEAFKKFSTEYTVIGGTALSLLLRPARQSKDIDIVLELSITDVDFCSEFEKYIKECDYKNKERQDGLRQFYRFPEPTNNECPKQLEIITSKGFNNNSRYTKINGMSNLSAMAILEEDYFTLLKNNRVTIENIPVLNHKAMIIFKAKAWLNLTEMRIEKPLSIQRHDIEKHKHDVVSLINILVPNDKLELTDKIKADMREFIKKCTFDESKIAERFATLCNIPVES